MDRFAALVFSLSLVRACWLSFTAFTLGCWLSVGLRDEDQSNSAWSCIGVTINISSRFVFARVLDFHQSCMLWMNIRPVLFSPIPGLSPRTLPTKFMSVCVTGHVEHCTRWTCLIYKYINFSLSHKAGPCLEQSADLGPEHLPKLIKLSEEIWI